MSGFLGTLKLQRCPHCGRTGDLNAHGYLRGHQENAPGKSCIRGRRVYCSNRFRRKGCGRTFSLLRALHFPNRTFTATGFWAFLLDLLRGRLWLEAMESLLAFYSLSGIYRVFRTFCLRQARIRAALLSVSPAPAMTLRKPYHQTVLHLLSCFPDSDCPLSEFQVRFQTPLL